MNEFEARNAFSPYLSWFRECWISGLQDYNNFLAHPQDDNRSRSVMIQNRAIIHAINSCSRYPSIKPFEWNTRRLFKFEDRAIIQFKKLTAREGELSLSNNMNKTAEAFDRQEHLPGLNDTPRITAGYFPNQDHTDMAFYILCTKSHYENNWILDISGQPVARNVDLFETSDEQLFIPSKRVRAKSANIVPDADDAAQG